MAPAVFEGTVRRQLDEVGRVFAIGQNGFVFNSKFGLNANVVSASAPEQQFSLLFDCNLANPGVVTSDI